LITEFDMTRDRAGDEVEEALLESSALVDGDSRVGGVEGEYAVMCPESDRSAAATPAPTPLVNRRSDVDVDVDVDGELEGELENIDDEEDDDKDDDEG
jgi:hypothetical protein